MKTRLLFILCTVSFMFYGCSKSEDLPEVVTYTVTTNVSKLNGGDGVITVNGVTVPASGILITQVSSGGSISISVEVEIGMEFSLSMNNGTTIRKNESYTYSLQNIISNKIATIVLGREEFDVNVSSSKGGNVTLSQGEPFFYGQTPNLEVVVTSADSVISSITIDGVVQDGVGGTKSFSKDLLILDDVEVEVIFMMTEAEILSRITTWKIESQIEYSPDRSVIILDHGDNPDPGATRSFLPSYKYQDISSRGTVNGHWKVERIGGKVFFGTDVSSTYEIVSITPARIVLERMMECIGGCQYPLELSVQTIVPAL